MQIIEAVRRQYERFPYPRVSILARAARHSVYLMNYESGVYACFGSMESAVERPKILVAGAGTFEPYIVALANPSAEIIAVDLSSRALKKLRQRLWLHGLSKRVKTFCGDLCELPVELGEFDMIVATGVLHHLPNPQIGLQKLSERLKKNGVMRIMLYSKFGRQSVYKLQALRKALKISTHKDFKKMIKLLPKEHPLKAQFYLYSDAETAEGLEDGFFHVCDTPFDALEIEDFLSSAKLEAKKFLHSHSGQPEAVQEYFEKIPDSKNTITARSVWEKIGVLDRLSELESNFIFWCARTVEIQAAAKLYSIKNKKIIPNPAFSVALPKEIHSKILSENIKVTKNLKKLFQGEVLSRENAENLLGADELEKLLRALILLEQ